MQIDRKIAKRTNIATTMYNKIRFVVNFHFIQMLWKILINEYLVRFRIHINIWLTDASSRSFIDDNVDGILALYG